jgi:hypothetical protein
MFLTVTFIYERGAMGVFCFEVSSDTTYTNFHYEYYTIGGKNSLSYFGHLIYCIYYVS